MQSAELAVDGLELAGRRRRGLGQRVLLSAARPELAGRQLDAVDQLLVAEADRQGDDPDAVRDDHLLGEVAGGIGDDADAHGAASLLGGVVRAAGQPRLGGVGGELGGGCACRVPFL